MIELTRIEGSLTVEFSISVEDDDLVQNLAFAYLVQMRHSGTASEPSVYLIEPGKYEAQIRVSFDDHKDFSDAWSHAYRNTSDDKVLDDYVGALDKADPDLSRSKRLAKMILAERKRLAAKE